MRVCAVPILYVYRIYMLNGRTRAKNPQQQEDKNEVDFVSRQMSHIELMQKTFTLRYRYQLPLGT